MKQAKRSEIKLPKHATISIDRAENGYVVRKSTETSKGYVSKTYVAKTKKEAQTHLKKIGV